MKKITLSLVLFFASFPLIAENRPIIKDPLGSDQFYVDISQVFDNWAIVILENVMTEQYKQVYLFTESENKNNSAISIVCGRISFKPSYLTYQDKNTSFGDKISGSNSIKIGSVVIYGDWIYKIEQLDFNSKDLSDSLQKLSDDDLIHIKYNDELYTFKAKGFASATTFFNKVLPNYCSS